jgi:broad specificity phosphatase PhoE
MAATFFLVRHASFDGLGEKLAGRAQGFSLNSKGKGEAAKLAERLAPLAIAGVHSSPQARARETAGCTAGRIGVEVKVNVELDEIDYGEWTGKSFHDLEGNPEWRHFNLFRSGTKIPKGESMVEVAQRALELLNRLRRQYEGKSAVLVTHADWIRVVLAHYAGICLDLMQRLEIGPASVSILRLHEHDAKILGVNDTGMLLEK